MLLLIVLLPFLGGLLCWQTDRVSTMLPRWIALFTMATVFVLTVLIWLRGDFTLSQQGLSIWAEEFVVDWIPRFGIQFSPGYGWHCTPDGHADRISRRHGCVVFMA